MSLRYNDQSMRKSLGPMAICPENPPGLKVAASYIEADRHQVCFAGMSGSTSNFEIMLYQLTGDEMFRGHRMDGRGWDWGWADWRREWMDETPGKYAYRCLPLTIANQTGWWVNNPVGFTAEWNGQPEPGNVRILFDADPGLWGGWINNQF